VAREGCTNAYPVCDERSVAPLHALVRRKCAFFLDLDGLVARCAAYAGEVDAHYELLDLVGAAVQCSAGALAVVSACEIATLAEVLDPFELPVAGLNGLERRNAQGMYFHPALRCARGLERARQFMTSLAGMDRRLVLAHTSFTVAVDYREVTDLEATVVHGATAIVAFVRGGLEVRHRRPIVEIRPSGVSKASAIAAFMRERPFRGRQPVCLGDDSCDEGEFEYVNAAGGLSVAVSVKRPTAARARLPSIGDTRGWLHALGAYLGRPRVRPSITTLVPQDRISNRGADGRARLFTFSEPASTPGRQSPRRESSTRASRGEIAQ
jgi:trehalose 6-phosphate phosphatase